MRTLTRKLHQSFPGASAILGVSHYHDVETIDRELELLAAVSASIRRLGGTSSTALIDELLDGSRLINQSD
jgi:hypothetical protein